MADYLDTLTRSKYIYRLDNFITDNIRFSIIIHSHRVEKRASQWEELMRKFSEAHKEECKTVSLDIPRAKRSAKQFPTGSRYEGTWDVLGMSGYGTYIFPNGVLYEGEFEDGMFQGQGELRYPSGAILRGKWRKGTMTERTLFFADGLEYSETDWLYCKMPDRRFTVEYKTGVQPAGISYLTADQPTKEIPAGFYDTGDGFYDPKTKMVYDVDDITAIIRSPSPLEQKWIIENCRTSPDVPLGPRPDLYEEWSEPVVEVPMVLSAPVSRACSFIESYSLDQDEDVMEEEQDSTTLKHRLASVASGRWNSRPFIKFNASTNYRPSKDTDRSGSSGAVKFHVTD